MLVWACMGLVFWLGLGLARLGSARLVVVGIARLSVFVVGIAWRVLGLARVGLVVARVGLGGVLLGWVGVLGVVVGVRGLVGVRGSGIMPLFN